VHQVLRQQVLDEECAGDECQRQHDEAGEDAVEAPDSTDSTGVRI